MSDVDTRQWDFSDNATTVWGVSTNNGPSDPLHLDGGQADQFYNLVMLRSTHLGLGVIKCIYGSEMG